MELCMIFAYCVPPLLGSTQYITGGVESPVGIVLSF